MSTLKIREDSTNYTCTVIKLPPKQQIPGLDNLVQVEVYGNTCLIGKDEPENQLYLYFPAGCQLSQQFLSANKLYRDVALNTYNNVDTKQEKGFFEPSGRVKGLKLKGIISTGFIIPIMSLEIMLPFSMGGDISELEAGSEFTDWCGFEVCRKYIPANQQTPGTPGTKDKNKVNVKLADVLIPTQFRFHVETTHLAKNLHKLNPNDVIVITDKWHGSSCILSRVYVNQKLNKAQKLYNQYVPLPKFATRKQTYITSSGKPKSNLPKFIEAVWENNGNSFYSTNIWKEALDKYKDTLEEGISIYGELVGFESTGKYIQKHYDYACQPTTCRFMVYRITYTKPNGEFIEFSWQQIKDYCEKYKLEHVREIYFGRAFNLFDSGGLTKELLDNPESWRQWFFTKLQTFGNLENNCTECNNNVPAEGIVLRIDGHLNRYDAFKIKSKLFVLGESNSDEITIEDEN